MHEHSSVHDAVNWWLQVHSQHCDWQFACCCSCCLAACRTITQLNECFVSLTRITDMLAVSSAPLLDRTTHTPPPASHTHTHTHSHACYLSHHWTIYRTCATHCLLSHPDSLGLMFSIYSPYVCLGPKRPSDLRPTVYSCSHAAIREKVLDTMLTKLVFHNALMLGIFLWMWISSV